MVHAFIQKCRMISTFILVYLFIHHTHGIVDWHHLKDRDPIPPTVQKWANIEAKNSFSILSVDVRPSSTWNIPSQNEIHKQQLNDAIKNEGHSFLKPAVCHIHLYGQGLLKSISKLIDGGHGYITIPSIHPKIAQILPSITQIPCYYMTSNNMGVSTRYDKPRTFGIVMNCPISMDMEYGYYQEKGKLISGRVCTLLYTTNTTIRVSLYPSDGPTATMTTNTNTTTMTTNTTTNTNTTTTTTNIPSTSSKLITSSCHITSIHHRQVTIKSLRLHPHAVCTVQTYRNTISGIMLYQFIGHYLRLGWHVIVYDRFGNHYKYIKDYLSNPRLHYYPYTIFQLIQPYVYNQQYANQQAYHKKYYFRYSKNIAKSNVATTLADTQNQDQDKSRTYDYCQMEYYRTFDLILYVDIDEFLYCPQANDNIKIQRQYQQQVMASFVSRQTEEVRISRIPYFGYANRTTLKEYMENDALLSMVISTSLTTHPGTITGSTTTSTTNNKVNTNYLNGDTTNNNTNHMNNKDRKLKSLSIPTILSTIQKYYTILTNQTTQCILNSKYQYTYNTTAFFACWSSASIFDVFPKNADLSNRCPFHYNHWSCDGGYQGGRTHQDPLPCRCLVDFEFSYGCELYPQRQQCHLIHLNDNDFIFNSFNKKFHPFLYGQFNEYNPMLNIL